jgi:lipoprotein-releasing system permease protein
LRYAFYIAGRYLFSKKSTNAINIISMISMLGVCIGSAALLVILSVFNGFEAINLSLYERLSPDLQISSAHGKLFDPSRIPTGTFSAYPQIDHTVQVLEDNALLKYGNTQYFATVKGVDQDFLKYRDLDSLISAGKFVLEDADENFAVIGRGIEYSLGIDVTQPIDQISIFSPRKDATVSLLQPERALNRMEIYPSGMFAVQQEMDDRVIFVPLRFAKELFEEQNQVSSIEVYLKNADDMRSVQQKLQASLGDSFKVKNRYQLNELLYKILNTEKWAVYLVLTFILVIAICNIIGSVTMLVIDKKKDIGILMSMGASHRVIRMIFLLEGLLISVSGGLIGLTLGGLFAWVQERYGFIKIQGSGDFLMSAYPVKIIFSDFVLVFCTLFLISFMASWFTARHTVKSFGPLRDAITE